MASAVKDLPEFRQTLSKLNQHISIAQQCMDSFTKKAVWEVSQLEQFMSTGADSNNTLLKKANLMTELVDMLENPKVDQLCKARLLAVFFITQTRISSVEERNALVKTAKISTEEHNAIKNLERLAVDFIPPTLTDKTEKKSTGFFTKFFNPTSDGVVTNDEGEIADSRHLSTLHTILEKSINGELSVDKYPPVDASMLITKQVAKSARRTAGGAQTKFGGKKNVYPGNRTIVFIAGGLSYAEMRIAGEDMIKHSKEIVMGGTHLINPTDYFEELKTLLTDEKAGKTSSVSKADRSSEEYEIVHV
jgi:syntaxin-binding protein 1